MELSGVVLGAAALVHLPTVLAFSLPLSPSGRDWNDYRVQHVGKWRGLWTTYDSAGVERGDPDRMDTTISLSADGKSVAHVNTLYVGSVGSDCSTCHDSVETRDIPAGQYTTETFRHRASSGCYLFGPGVTRGGDMTTELGFRLDEDRRVRVLVSHRPQANGVEPPLQLALQRIVVVRETLAAQRQTPPSASSCWSFDRPSWVGLWRGHEMVLDDGGGDTDGGLSWKEKALPPTHLRRCRCSGAAIEDDDSHASFELDGGILLEAPKIVDAGKPAELSVRCAIGRKSNAATPNRIVQAKVRLEALSRVVDTVRSAAGENVRIAPPKLLELSVHSLTPVESAGLK
ncbi:unnamed protein product [Ectocarpus sp. 12 AP-2014]